MLTTLAGRVRALLTSTRGDLTSQSVIGAVIVSLMSVGMVGTFMAMLAASQAAATTSSRSAILAAEAAAHQPQVHALLEMDTPLRFDHDEAPGGPSTVWVWAHRVSELEAEIHAAMPRLGRHGDLVDECTTPAGRTDFAGKLMFDKAPGCLAKTLPVTLDLAGVTSGIVVADGQDTYLHTTVDDATSELRYVVLVTDISGPDAGVAIVHTGRDGQQREHVIDTDEPGYYFGGLDVTDVAELHFEPRGTVIDQDRSMIYEAPR